MDGLRLNLSGKYDLIGHVSNAYLMDEVVQKVLGRSFERTFSENCSKLQILFSKAKKGLILAIFPF